MRLDRLFVALIVVILTAAAAVFVAKHLRAAGEDTVELDARPGSARFLMVGIEGLEISIVERMSAEGRLPELTKLMSGGALGKFDALGKGVDRRISWTSVVTGVAPERQGVGGTMISNRGEVVDAPLIPASRTVGTLWTALSESRPPVGVFGWEGTWPAEKLDGVMVAPYMTYVLEREHGGNMAHIVSPPEFCAEVDPLIEEGGAYSRKDLARFVDVDTRLGLEARIGKGYEDLGIAVAGDRSMVALARRQSGAPGAWNLFVFLGGVELVSQRFWHMANPDEIHWDDLTEETTDLVTGQCEALGVTIERYYEFVDALVGELVELVASDGTVAVVSDHGYEGLRYNDRGHPMIGSHLHNETGFWIIHGPRVRSGVRAPEGSLLDVAPVIATALGIELRDVPDGRAHEDVFVP